MAGIQQAPEMPCLCLPIALTLRDKGQGRRINRALWKPAQLWVQRTALRKVGSVKHGTQHPSLNSVLHTHKKWGKGGGVGKKEKGREKGGKLAVHILVHAQNICSSDFQGQKLLRKGIVDLNGRNTLNLHFLYYLNFCHMLSIILN